MPKNKRMKTSIRLSQETNRLISTFGTKEDTYDDIVKHMYDLAVKEQIHPMRCISDHTLSIEEAKTRHRAAHWPTRRKA